MNIKKLDAVWANYSKAQKMYEKMLTDLHEIIKKESGLKISFICEKIGISEQMFRYYFRKKNVPQTVLKKLFKLLKTNSK